jgi:hypothetical protein
LLQDFELFSPSRAAAAAGYRPIAAVPDRRWSPNEIFPLGSPPRWSRPTVREDSPAGGGVSVIIIVVVIIIITVVMRITSMIIITISIIILLLLTITNIRLTVEFGRRCGGVFTT